jgi:hypothetical protein
VTRLARPLLFVALLAAAGSATGGNLTSPVAAEPPAAAEAAARQAREEAAAGSRAFAAGAWLAAAESFGRAAGLDPAQRGYAVLRARALGELVVRGDLSPENRSRLLTVVSIYEELLSADPANEEYAQSVSSLFAKAGDEEGRDAWLLRRARDGALPAEIRAAAFRAVAETALAGAARENASGRRETAAALAARARLQLDEALALFPDALACHALLLHGLELEVAIAGEWKDGLRQARFEALLAQARRSADAAAERARLAAVTPDDY